MRMYALPHSPGSASFIENEPFDGALVAPVLQQLLERIPARPVRAEQRPRRFDLALVGEIAGCALALELRGVELRCLEVFDVSVLCFLARLDRPQAALQRFAHDVRDVIPLPPELLGRARIQPALNVARVELIRKTVSHDAVQGARAVRPVLVDRLAIAALDRPDAPATIEIARDLEAARENDAVDRVFDAARHEAVRRNALHAARRR